MVDLIEADGLESRTALLPVPGAATYGYYQTLRRGIPVQELRLKRATRSPGLLVTARGIPGEVHAHLSVADSGHQRLIVRVVEPGGLSRTGHDDAELASGRRGRDYHLVTTDNPEEAAAAVQGWLHQMRSVRPIRGLDRSAELRALHKERQSWRNQLDLSINGRNSSQLDDVCDVDIRTSMSSPCSRSTKSSLKSESANTSAVDLVWNFPRGERGKIRKSEVLLACLEPGREHAPGRTLWLVASSAASGHIIVEPKAVGFASDRAHRWDVARWLWDRRQIHTTPDERWSMNINSFRTDGADPVRVSIRLLQERSFEHAFEMAELEMSDEVKRLASGRRLAYEPSEPAEWSTTVATLLERSAPWLIAKRGAPYVANSYGPRFARIASLPRQSQTRKASLVLAVPKPGRPRIELRWTGTPHRLPEPLWVRPAEIDLMLMGIALEDLLPYRSSDLARS
jgi:hypothetical protein